MMDTTNSLGNNSGVSLNHNKYKPRMHFKVSGSPKVTMNGLKKSIHKEKKTAPESSGSLSSESAAADDDGASSNSSSSSESENGRKTLPRSSSHSLWSSASSHRSNGSNDSSKRSNLKKTQPSRAEADNISETEEYGDIMKDYCYNENNVLVPRIKLEVLSSSSSHHHRGGGRGVDGGCDDDNDDEISVGSSVSARERLRRGGRRPGNKNKNNGDNNQTEGTDNASSPSGKRKTGRRKDNFSFWDQDTDSSESESEIFRISEPSKKKSAQSSSLSSSPPQYRFSMIGSSRKSSAATPSMKRESSGMDSSSDDNYFTAQEGPSEPRRGVSRNDSGWNTGGSFDSDDEDFVFGPPKRTAFTSKLSQAAQRMSRSDGTGCAFSFTKKNANMDSYAANPSVDEDDNLSERDDSNHSEASKTTSSFVSAGGWSTGKDSSSSEDEDSNKRRPVATKKGANNKAPKRESKSKQNKPPIEDLDPFAEFDNPKDGPRSMKISGHSAESKFSFVSAGSMDSGSTFSDETEKDAFVPISTKRHGTDGAKGLLASEMNVLTEENNGSFVFDLSGMNLDSNDIFADNPPFASKIVKDAAEDIRSPDAKARAKSAAVEVTPEDNEKARKRATRKVKKEKDSAKKSIDGKKGKLKAKKDKLKSASEHVTGKSKPSSKPKKDKLEGASEHITEKEKTRISSSKSKKDKKKKSSDEKSVDTASRKEAKEPKQAATTENKFLEKRRAERAVRLEIAKERIKQQELEKKEEAETARKKKTAMRPKKPALSRGTEFERRERAYQWYTRCGMLNKVKLKERLRTIRECDVSDADVDLLPWMTGDRIVNVAKMLKILREH